jgi:hypothetical protein
MLNFQIFCNQDQFSTIVYFISNHEWHIACDGSWNDLNVLFDCRALRETKTWLIDSLRCYVPLKNISLIWRRHHCRWRAAKFRPMLGAQGLWAGRDLYRATPTVTQDLGFPGLIRRTAPFSRLLRHTRGCGGSILTRILTGWNENKCWVKTSVEWLPYHLILYIYRSHALFIYV